MTYSKEHAGAKEVWAVVWKDTREVCWSRGGSSTRAKLMVYDSEKSARRVLKGPWIKQQIKDASLVDIVCLYSIAEVAL